VLTVHLLLRAETRVRGGRAAVVRAVVLVVVAPCGFSLQLQGLSIAPRRGRGGIVFQLRLRLLRGARARGG